jgi:hypothetical protein
MIERKMQRKRDIGIRHLRIDEFDGRRNGNRFQRLATAKYVRPEKPALGRRFESDPSKALASLECRTVYLFDRDGDRKR